MTIDERLEFLVKSTESLHATLHELIAENEKRWEKNEKRWEKNEERWEKTSAEIDKLTKVMAAIAQTVLDHEDRLNES